MIIAQMMTTPKVPAAADLPQTDADANADTLDDGEFFDQAASSDGDSAEKDVAEESKEAEVGNQQADPKAMPMKESNATERTFHGLLS